MAPVCFTWFININPLLQSEWFIILGQFFNHIFLLLSDSGRDKFYNSLILLMLPNKFKQQIISTQIKVLNDSKEIAATLYLSSAILGVVIVVSLALSKWLNVYTACYCYGIPLATSVVLIVVFFTKVRRVYLGFLSKCIVSH